MVCVVEKMKENKLKWFEYVERREKNEIVKKIYDSISFLLFILATINVQLVYLLDLIIQRVFHCEISSYATIV